MKFDYKVKYNGKWYMPNEEITETIEITPKYTKTDIHRMNTSELRNFAVEQGIENPEQLTGKELKELLLGKFDD